MEKKRSVLALMVVLVALILIVSVSYAGVSIPQPEWFAADTWTWVRNKNTTNPFKWTVTDFKKIDGIEVYEVLTGVRTLYYTKSLGLISTVDKNGQLIYANKPAMEYFKWPLTASKKWVQVVSWKDYKTGAFDTVRLYFEAKGVEKISVLAGEFETIKLVRSTESRVWDEYWYAPEVKNYVKLITYRGENGEVKATDELFDYKLGGPIADSDFSIKEAVVYPSPPKVGEYSWIIFKFSSKNDLVKAEAEMSYEKNGQLVNRRESLALEETGKYKNKTSGTVTWRWKYNFPGKRDFTIWLIDHEAQKSNTVKLTIEVH